MCLMGHNYEDLSAVVRVSQNQKLQNKICSYETERLLQAKCCHGVPRGVSHSMSQCCEEGCKFIGAYIVHKGEGAIYLVERLVKDLIFFFFLRKKSLVKDDGAISKPVYLMQSGFDQIHEMI